MAALGLSGQDQTAFELAARVARAARTPSGATTPLQAAPAGTARATPPIQVAPPHDHSNTPALPTVSPPQVDTPRPTGMVTFLFTDVESSTHLWEQHPAWHGAGSPPPRGDLREAIAAHGGWAYKQIGDAFQAAFQNAPHALAAAVAAQRALANEPWGGPGPLKVRMALHTGTTEERADD